MIAAIGITCMIVSLVILALSRREIKAARKQISLAQEAIEKASRIKPRIVTVAPFDRDSREQLAAIAQVGQVHELHALLATLKDAAIRTMLELPEEAPIQRLAGKIAAYAELASALTMTSTKYNSILKQDEEEKDEKGADDEIRF